MTRPQPPDRPAYLGDMRWPKPGDSELWVGVAGLERREYRPDAAIVDDLAQILAVPAALTAKPATA